MPNKIPGKSFGRADTTLIALVLSRTVYSQVPSDFPSMDLIRAIMNTSGFKKVFPKRSEMIKKESEDNHREGRLNNGPQAPKNSLLITDLDVSFCQKIEEFVIFPDLFKVNRNPAPFRLDNGDWKGRFVHISELGHL
jgi:hypothetical protein